VRKQYDRRKKKDVVDQLFWDSHVDSSNVKVKVSNGIVTLEGTVSSYPSRQSAFEDAWMVDDVISVVNKLEVKYPMKFEVPSDEEIKKRVDAILFRDPMIESKDIRADVVKGWVHLNGSVDSYWKTIRAENLASETFGVIGITNNLTVVPTGDFKDQVIASDVIAALKRNVFVDAELIDVKVKDGVVTLSGTVPNRHMARAAFQAALFTNRIKLVRDDLKVAQPVRTVSS